MSNDLITVSGNNYQLVDGECVLSADKLPGWLIGYIDDLVNLKIKELSLDVSNTVNNTVNNYTNGFDTYIAEYVNRLSTTNYGDIYDFMSGYNARVLTALDQLEVVKNDYREYIIRNITENSALVAYVQTLNSTIAGNDATIKTLLQTYATKEFAASTAALTLEAELNGGKIGAAIKKVETAMATQYGAMASYVRSLEANYTDRVSSLEAKAGVYEAALAYAGKAEDGPGVDSIAGRAARLEAYVTDPDTGDFYSTGATQDLGSYVKANVQDGVKDSVVDAYSKFSTISIGGKKYVNGFGLFSGYSKSNNEDVSGNSTFWVAADQFKFYDSKSIKTEDDITFATIEDSKGNPIRVVTGIKSTATLPFQIDGGVVKIGYESVSGGPTYTSGTGAPTNTTAINGSVYRDTANNVTYTLINGSWVATVPQTQITSIVFKRFANPPTTAPTGGTYASPYPTSDTWYDGIPPENGNPCYYTTRVFLSTGDTNTWDVPQLLSNTNDIVYVYSTAALGTTPTLDGTTPILSNGRPIAPSGWDDTPTSETNWVAVSTMRNGVWSSWAVYQIKGETGKGLSSITSYYAAHASSTVAPSTWVTSMPTLSSIKKYLWNYEKLTYSDGSSVNTIPIVVGNYSKDGVGIKSIDEYYIRNNSTETPSENATWYPATDPIITTGTGTYLWNKTVITFTDNSTKVTIVMSTRNGAPGNRGAATTSITTTTGITKYANYNADFATAIGPDAAANKVKGDTLIVTSTHATDGGTKTFVRDSNGGTTWTSYGLMVNGNALIKGSLTVDKIQSGTAIDANFDSKAFVIAGTMTPSYNGAVIGWNPDSGGNGAVNAGIIGAANHWGVCGVGFNNGTGGVFGTATGLDGSGKYFTYKNIATLGSASHAGYFGGKVEVQGKGTVVCVESFSGGVLKLNSAV